MLETETKTQLQIVKDLLMAKHDESSVLEFKKSIAGLEAAGKTLSAFLNQLEGGMVLIGVSNDGKIIGQEYNDSVSKKIAAFLNKFQPTGRIEVNYAELDITNKRVIILKAKPLSHERPYSYDGKYYERMESTTQQLSHDHIRYLYLESDDTAKLWGEKTSDRYKMDDLDLEEIKNTIKRGIEVNRIPGTAAEQTVEEVLAGLNLIEDNGKITHSAVILFAKNISKLLPQCKIRMARFKGNNKYGEFIDNQKFVGNAFQILRTAEDFIRKHHFISSRFVREALLNAICHRNYHDRSGSIDLAIYDEHTEIWNYGSLPPGWTLDKLKQRHKSLPRNELIADVFFAREYIETWGKGIQTIIKECKKANVPEPEYEQYSGGIAVKFYYREPLGVAPPKHRSKSIVVTERQEAILDILEQEKSMSLKDIANTMPEVHERLIRNDLYALRKLGKIEISGHGRGATWRLRIRPNKTE
jgi:ATP-dependent DNA helicase RecG